MTVETFSFDGRGIELSRSSAVTAVVALTVSIDLGANEHTFALLVRMLSIIINLRQPIADGQIFVFVELALHLSDVLPD